MRYIAARSFQTEVNGRLVQITQGVDRVDEHHELYQRFPDNWKPLGEADVEQATAAPGEKRGGLFDHMRWIW